MEITKPFLSSSEDSLSLNDYRRIRKICDDATYYNMHPIDKSLLEAGSMIVKGNMWPELNIFNKLDDNQQKNLLEKSIVLNYYRDVLVDSMSKNKYNHASLIAMKLFSDIMYYANDPSSERIKLLDDIQQAVKQEENPALWVYRFIRIPLKPYDKNAEFLYHPNFFSSSTLYRLTELEIKYSDNMGKYFLNQKKTVNSDRALVLDALKNFPSFNLGQMSRFSNEEQELAARDFYTSAEFYPPRNSCFRVMLDHIAGEVWNSSHIENQLLDREDETIRYAIGQDILKDYLLKENDGKYIFDPNISRDSIPEIYNSMAYKMSEYSINKSKEDLTEVAKTFVNAVNEGAITGRINKLDNSVLIIPKSMDIILAFYKRNQIYQKSQKKTEIWNNTYEADNNNFVNVDLEYYMNKDYNGFLTKNPEVELIDSEPSIPMLQEDAKKQILGENYEAFKEAEQESSAKVQSDMDKLNELKQSIKQLADELYHSDEEAIADESEKNY